MIPIRTLAETTTPDGSKFSLHEHDGDYFLRINGQQLMSGTWTLSERLLADYGCPKGEKRNNMRVLIGGLGLGFTLKRVLELAGENAQVVVAELLPEVVEWNRTHLQGVNGKLLDDPRVKIFHGDVYECIVGAAGAKNKWDAMLLDVDNGPTGLVQPQNSQLYDHSGYDLIWNALSPGGIAAFWAATMERGLDKPLQREGFWTECYAVKAHENAKKAAHRIYTAQRPEGKEKPTFRAKKKRGKKGPKLGRYKKRGRR